MPTGCDQTLAETQTPGQWLIDPHNAGSSGQESRKSAFNSHCSRTDALNYWGHSPPGTKIQIIHRHIKNEVLRKLKTN